MAGLFHGIGKLYILKAMEQFGQDKETGIVFSGKRAG